jgi:hypothetical protein
VDDAAGLRQQRRQLEAERIRQQLQPVEHRNRRILRGRRELGQGRPAEIVDRDEIGEGATDIDADAIHGANSVPVVASAVFEFPIARLLL